MNGNMSEADAYVSAVHVCMYMHDYVVDNKMYIKVLNNESHGQFPVFTIPHKHCKGKQSVHVYPFMSCCLCE